MRICKSSRQLELRSCIERADMVERVLHAMGMGNGHLTWLCLRKKV